MELLYLTIIIRKSKSINHNFFYKETRINKVKNNKRRNEKVS